MKGNQVHGLDLNSISITKLRGWCRHHPCWLDWHTEDAAADRETAVYREHNLGAIVVWSSVIICIRVAVFRSLSRLERGRCLGLFALGSGGRKLGSVS